MEVDELEEALIFLSRDHVDADPNGIFSVMSARVYVDEVFLPAVEVETRWNKYMPIKVNVFVWRALLNRIPTRKNLVDKNSDISSLFCPCCELQTEDVSHVFLHCKVARQLWHRIACWIDLPFPSVFSIDELLSWINMTLISKNKRYVSEVIVSTSMWELELELELADPWFWDLELELVRPNPEFLELELDLVGTGRNWSELELVPCGYQILDFRIWNRNRSDQIPDFRIWNRNRLDQFQFRNRRFPPVPDPDPGTCKSCPPLLPATNYQLPATSFQLPSTS
ncbi:hypothetical protein LXL04_008962 [Taraxacum kok-saghyz]